MSDWSALVDICTEFASGREAIRLANLSVAAAAAQHRLVKRRYDERGFAEMLSQLAVEPLSHEPTDFVSRRLVEVATHAAHIFGRPSSMDAWVQAFQSTDPARKSRGAYATPQVLARPMARELLRTGTPGRVVDPSSGAGGLLLAVFAELKRKSVNDAELRSHVARLHGVELDPVARELSCLLLWLHAGIPELSPRLVAERIITGNAITRDWWSTDPFDALIMNPPWDSLRHNEVEPDEELERGATSRRLLEARTGAAGLPLLFSAHGRGDRNLYKAFVELAPHLLTERGRLVALIPGAWSSDLGTTALRRMYLEHLDVEQWTSFENLRGYFPIDGRYKFGVLVAERATGGTDAFRTRGFAADAADIRRRHVTVTAADLDLLGGPAAILPDLVSARERRIMLRVLSRGHGLFAGSGPFGTVRYSRELDMTEDRKRGLFHHVTESGGAVPATDGTWVDAAGVQLVPLVEGRMISAYDFHAKSWQSGSGRTAKWTWSNGHRLNECRPQFLAPPRAGCSTRIAICDVTSATNTRTVLASWVPPTWSCGNTAPVLIFASERLALAGLAVLNSMVFDWLARRVMAGLHLNRFYLDALTWPDVDWEGLNQLAGAAVDLTAMSPRYVDLGPNKLGVAPTGLTYVEAHARIEVLVAKGFGLSAADVATVLDPSRSDRRGFWRHFASDPHSAGIAATVLEQLSRDSAVGRQAVTR